MDKTIENKLKLWLPLLFLFFLLVAGCGGKSSSPSKNHQEIEVPLAIRQLNFPYLSIQNKALEEIKNNAQFYIPILKKILLHHDLLHRRALAAKALGKMGEIAQDAVFELTQALDDPEPSVQALSAWALGKIGHPLPQTITKLITLLKNKKDPDEITATGAYEDRKDTDLLVRQNAALALGRMAPETTEATHTLIDVFLYDNNSQVRLNAALALEKLSPHARCGHISIAQTMREITSRIYLYASLCFKPERSLEEGATSDEIFKYYQELKKEFLPTDFDWGKDTFPSLTSLKVEQKYSNNAILACAQRNFNTHSVLDKQWFQVLDQYGYTPEEFKPFQADFLQYPLLSIGNDHPLAMSHHGKILFELTQFLYDHQKIPTLLAEVSYNSDNYAKDLEYVREDFKDHPILKGTDPLSYVQELDDIYNLDADYMRASWRWLDQPRDRLEEAYALTYPSAKMIPLDLGPERISDVCGVHLSTLQNLIDHRNPQETFLLFYGAAHIVRFGTNDTLEIENNIHCDNQPLKTFTIGQFANPNALLEQALQRSLLHHAQSILIEKFSFPVKITPESAKSAKSDRNTFSAYWDQMIDKYNSTRSKRHLPLYIYLAQAQKNHALSFFNNNIAPYDLFLIPAAKDASSPFDIKPFDIKKDNAYLSLKRTLEEDSQKLTWLAN